MLVYCFSLLVLFQVLARQQAQREEELAQTQRHILALQVCDTKLLCTTTVKATHEHQDPLCLFCHWLRMAL